MSLAEQDNASSIQTCRHIAFRDLNQGRPGVQVALLSYDRQGETYRHPMRFSATVHRYWRLLPKSRSTRSETEERSDCSLPQ